MTACLVNPLFVYLAVWSSVAALYAGGLWTGLFPPAAPKLAWAVALNVATFSLGYLTWNLLGWLKAADGAPRAQRGYAETADELEDYLNVTLKFGLLAVVLCAGRIVVLAHTYKIDLQRVVSDPYLWQLILTSIITEDMIAVRLCTIAISVATSVFSIGFVVLGLWLYIERNQRRYRYVLLFLAMSLGIGLLSLARKQVTINILFTVLSYLLAHQLYHTRRLREIAWHLGAPIVALAALFLIIEALLEKGATFERQDPLTGFLFSLYWYLASPLAAFGEFLKTHDYDWRLGQSLFFPIHKWLVRFHLLAQADTTSIVYMEKIYIPYPANVYTYLRNIYEDFGFFGLAIIPYFLGAIAAGVQYQARRLLSYLNVYMVVLIVIIFSFYDHLLVSNQFYMQILFGFILFRHEFDGPDGTIRER